MLIEAPIQKKTYMDFHLLGGIWLSRVELLCTLQQSTGLHFYPLNYTALLSYAVHFTEKFKRIYVVSIHRNSIHWTALNFTV